MRIGRRESLTSQVRRDRILFFTPIAVALVLLALFAENRAVFASAWRDPVAVMADRSPGARSPNALYNIKPEYVSLGAGHMTPSMPVVPQERVLAVTRERPPAIVPGVPAEEVAPIDFVLDDTPLALGGLPPMAFQAPSIPLVPLETRPSPGCCGGVNVPGLTVPEPATWAMNIIGLFVVGGVLRRRNRRARAAHSGSALPGHA